VQRKESFTTGSFAVAQFDSSQKPLVAFGNVPKTVNRWFMIECWHWESKQSAVKSWSLIVVIAIAALRFR